MMGLESSARREGLVVLVLTVIGAGLRCWSFGALGLTHFDEGIYALSGLWVLSPHGLASLDPMVIPYAPPGLPILIGLSYGLFGVADGSAIFPSLLCGVLSIPVVGWIGRRTFGPGAGAGAAALAAFSMAHIAFSRKALTDVPFLLFWVVALGLGGWFLERPRLGRALLMGLAVGLAQCFKYNGWLAGAIVILTALLGLVFRRAERATGVVMRTFGYGLTGALVAALVYWPWFRFVAGHGGYGSLLRHQQGYLGGFRQWPAHFAQQIRQVVALSGGWAWQLLGLAMTAVSFELVRNRPRVFQSLLPGKWVLAFAGIAILSMIHTFDSVLSVLYCSCVLCSIPRLSGEARPTIRLLGVASVALTVLIPFYHPYARLWLPLHALGWLIVGGVMCNPDLLKLARPAAAGPGGTLPLRKQIIHTLFPIFWFPLFLCTNPFNPPWTRALLFARFFEPTSSFRDAAALVMKEERQSATSTTRTRVLARRPLAYYLILGGSDRFALQSGLDQLLEPNPSGAWALVDDAMLIQEGNLDQAMQRLLDQAQRESGRATWTQVSAWPVLLDPVTLLDVVPSAVYDEPKRGPVTLRLLKPSEPTDSTP